MRPVVKEREVDDKKWALGLTQKDFEIQFKRRYKYADCVPIGAKWVEYPEKPPLRFIPPVPETKAEVEAKVNPDDLILFCSGCKKEFKPFQRKSIGKWYQHKVGLMNHEKHCKALLEIRS